MEAKFVIDGEPKGKGRPRFNRYTGHAVTPRETANYEAVVRFEYASQCKGIRFSDDAMLDMRITSYYAVAKSDSRKKREAKLNGALRPTKKPDCDNVVKIIADSLNGVAYRDDTQIVDCQVRKFFSEKPRVVVRIKEINNTNREE